MPRLIVGNALRVIVKEVGVLVQLPSWEIKVIVATSVLGRLAAEI